MQIQPATSRIAALDLANRYGVQAPPAPKIESWGLIVAYVFDLSGVIWHVAAEPNRAAPIGA